MSDHCLECGAPCEYVNCLGAVYDDSREKKLMRALSDAIDLLEFCNGSSYEQTGNLTEKIDKLTKILKEG